MLQDVHTAKVSAKVVAAPGANVIVAADADAYIYVHELIGDLDVNGTITILAGSRVLAEFALDAGQGLTEQDEPGMDGVPRFQCRPGEAFNLTLSAGSTFRGSIDYSKRQ